MGKDLDLFCYSSIPGYCNLLSCEEEKATYGDFVPCITKAHVEVGKSLPAVGTGSWRMLREY